MNATLPTVAAGIFRATTAIVGVVLFVCCPCAAEVTAITGAQIIPMTSEAVLDDHAIVIENGRISALCPVSVGCIPTGATVIDGTGMFLIPGLIDSHNHFGGVAFDGRDETRIRTRDQHLRQYVMFGVTTVRDPAGNPLVLQARDQINRGELFGPRIFTSWGVMDGDPPLFTGAPAFAEPERAAEFVRMTKKFGYDFVKVYSTMDTEVFDAVMAAARETGLTVAAHVPIRVPLEHALKKGLRSIEHLTGYDVACAYPERIMRPIVEDIYQGWAWCTPGKVKVLAAMTAAYEVWNVPTLSLWDNTVTEFDRPRRATEGLRRFEHPLTRAGFDWLYSIYGPRARAGITGTRSTRLGLVKALSDAGAPVLVGTDVSATGYTVHREMGLFVEAGLTAYQALHAATAEAARYLRKEGEFGTLVPGASADMVLLEANPLVDIANTRLIRGLMIRGEWWSKQMIDAEIAAIQREYAEDAARLRQLGIDAPAER
ncbi:MAG: amidohydrolase family protein [Gammaproteobacteria bacterium]|nr:amidohydrolase family protein [Gammaproteobacteria bacterium]MYF27424.1 amidohydrolase family protein [Gammaproteobacteria bacterium]MYK48622.1 amidohydrolase family protein [Gammaproteobacteria bacterium]